jgi:hypothetical protein
VQPDDLADSRHRKDGDIPGGRAFEHVANPNEEVKGVNRVPDEPVWAVSL